MTIQELIHRLQTEKSVTLLHTGLCQPEQIIRRIQIAEPLPAAPEPGTLYLCEGLPAVPVCGGCSLMAVCRAPIPGGSIRPEAGNLICVSAQGTRQLAETISCLLAQGDELRGDMLRLSQAFLSDRGLAYLCDEAAAVFCNPVWMIDINFNFITSPQAALIDRDDILNQEARLGYVLDEHVDNLKRRKIYESIHRTGEVTTYSSTVSQERKIIAAQVRVKSVTVGFLQLGNNHAPFRACDAELLQYAAKLFAAELQKSQHVEINQGNMFAGLLKSLLDGRLKDKASLAQRMSTLGITIGRRFQFLCIPIDSGKLEQSEANTIANQVRYFLFNAVYIIEPTQILFLINFYGEDPLDADTMRDLREYLSNGHLCAGLSPTFSDILCAPSYCPLAAAAAEVGSILDPGVALYDYGDYALYHMIHASCCAVPAAATAAGAGLLALQQYDREHHTALFETLYCYLDCLQNVTSAAERLGIHGNTLRNRIEKIRELTHCPLDQGQQVLEFLMAYKINSYQKSLERI